MCTMMMVASLQRVASFACANVKQYHRLACVNLQWQDAMVNYCHHVLAALLRADVGTFLLRLHAACRTDAAWLVRNMLQVLASTPPRVSRPHGLRLPHSWSIYRPELTSQQLARHQLNATWFGNHGDTPFLSACRHGAFATAEMLLVEFRSDILATDHRGRTALFLICASQGRRRGTVTTGCDDLKPDAAAAATTATTTTLLTQAENNDVDAQDEAAANFLRLLFNRGCDITSRPRYFPRSTPLHALVSSAASLTTPQTASTSSSPSPSPANHRHVSLAILEEFCRISVAIGNVFPHVMTCIDRQGHSVLETACRGMQLDVVRRMLRHPHIRGDRLSCFQASVDVAAAHGCLDVAMVTELVDAGGGNLDFHHPLDCHRWRYHAIHSACRVGNLPLVQLLVRMQPAAVSAVSGSRRSLPLHVAARYGHIAVARFLLACDGCDVLAKNMDCETALHCVAAATDAPDAGALAHLLLQHVTCATQRRICLNAPAWRRRLRVRSPIQTAAKLRNVAVQLVFAQHCDDDGTALSFDSNDNDLDDDMW